MKEEEEAAAAEEKLLKGRQEVEKITGITIREQERIEKGVKEVIDKSKTTADAMKNLVELGTDIKSVYAGAVLQGKTANRTKICLAIPAYLLEMLCTLEMLDALETLGIPGFDAD